MKQKYSEYEKQKFSQEFKKKRVSITVNTKN